MFDFPAPPSVGQIISGPNGSFYQWDGKKWTPTAFVQQPLGTISLGARNYIHNPIFRWWQRGAGPWTTNGTLTADRWGLGLVTDTMSATQVTMLDADRTAIGDERAQWALKITNTGNAGAGAYSYVTQRMEQLWRFSNKVVIVSFWAYGTTLPFLGVNMLSYFGTGGSPTTNFWQTAQILPITTNWQRYSAIFSVPSLAGTTFGTSDDSMFGLAFIMSSGSGNSNFAGTMPTQSGTLYLWGVQVEIAQPGQTQPSPLDRPDEMVDYNNCRRFYQTGQFEVAGWQLAGAGLGYTHAFSPYMRTTPTVTSSALTLTNCTGTITSQVTPYSIIPYATTTASGSVLYAGQFQASADI